MALRGWRQRLQCQRPPTPPRRSRAKPTRPAPGALTITQKVPPCAAGWSPTAHLPRGFAVGDHLLRPRALVQPTELPDLVGGIISGRGGPVRRVHRVNVCYDTRTRCRIHTLRFSIFPNIISPQIPIDQQKLEQAYLEADRKAGRKPQTWLQAAMAVPSVVAPPPSDADIFNLGGPPVAAGAGAAGIVPVLPGNNPPPGAVGNGGPPRGGGLAPPPPAAPPTAARGGAAPPNGKGPAQAQAGWGSAQRQGAAQGAPPPQPLGWGGGAPPPRSPIISRYVAGDMRRRRPPPRGIQTAGNNPGSAPFSAGQSSPFGFPEPLEQHQPPRSGSLHVSLSADPTPIATDPFGGSASFKSSVRGGDGGSDDHRTSNVRLADPIFLGTGMGGGAIMGTSSTSDEYLAARQMLDDVTKSMATAQAVVKDLKAMQSFWEARSAEWLTIHRAALGSRMPEVVAPSAAVAGEEEVSAATVGEPTSVGGGSATTVTTTTTKKEQAGGDPHRVGTHTGAAAAEAQPQVVVQAEAVVPSGGGEQAEGVMAAGTTTAGTTSSPGKTVAPAAPAPGSVVGLGTTTSSTPGTPKSPGAARRIVGGQRSPGQPNIISLGNSARISPNMGAFNISPMKANGGVANGGATSNKPSTPTVLRTGSASAGTSAASAPGGAPLPPKTDSLNDLKKLQEERWKAKKEGGK